MVIYFALDALVVSTAYGTIERVAHINDLHGLFLGMILLLKIIMYGS